MSYMDISSGNLSCLHNDRPLPAEEQNYVISLNLPRLHIHTDGIPPDGSPEILIRTFHVSLVAVYYSLAALGITLAIACLVFNFAFRKTK